MALLDSLAGLSRELRGATAGVQTFAGGEFMTDGWINITHSLEKMHAQYAEQQLSPLETIVDKWRPECLQ